VNPFTGLKPTKARKRGKPQYRIDELRKLLEVCLAEDSKAGAAVAVTLLCGMRASAVTNRSVRDLDDGGRILWIERDKTEAGNRRLVLPDVLQDQLARFAAGRPGSAKLFENTNRDWLRYHTRRLAALAGVPVLSPHSLRGTWASIARGGLVIEHVAAALGHASPSITRRNYLSPGLEGDIDQKSVSALLLGDVGKTSAQTVPHES
jgi:integrase